MKMWRNGVLQICLFLSASVVVIGYPIANTTCVVPFAPGGEGSVLAQLHQAIWQAQNPGLSFNVVYEAGGSGAVGWSEVKNYPLNATKIVTIFIPHIISEPLVGCPGSNVCFNTADLAITYIAAYTPNVLMVNATTPIYNMQDFLDYADKIGPQNLAIGGSGAWTAHQLMHDKFISATKRKFPYHPFLNGTAELVDGLKKGLVQATWASSYVAVKFPELRSLAVSAEFALSTLPDVPTMVEIGINIIDGTYRAVGLPADTPAELQTEVSNYFDALNRDVGFQASLNLNGFVPLFMDLPRIQSFIGLKTAEIQSQVSRMTREGTYFHSTIETQIFVLAFAVSLVAGLAFLVVTEQAVLARMEAKNLSTVAWLLASTVVWGFCVQWSGLFIALSSYIFPFENAPGFEAKLALSSLPVSLVLAMVAMIVMISGVQAKVSLVTLEAVRVHQKQQSTNQTATKFGNILGSSSPSSPTAKMVAKGVWLVKELVSIRSTIAAFLLTVSTILCYEMTLHSLDVRANYSENYGALAAMCIVCFLFFVPALSLTFHFISSTMRGFSPIAFTLGIIFLNLVGFATMTWQYDFQADNFSDNDHIFSFNQVPFIITLSAAVLCFFLMGVNVASLRLTRVHLNKTVHEILKRLKQEEQDRKDALKRVSETEASLSALLNCMAYINYRPNRNRYFALSSLLNTPASFQALVNEDPSPETLTRLASITGVGNFGAGGGNIPEGTKSARSTMAAASPSLAPKETLANANAAHAALLEGVMHHPVCIELFKDHCERDHCQENVFFWLDVQLYKEAGKKKMKEMALSIVRVYIEQGAPLQVNISAKFQTTILDTASKGKRGLFDDAETEVMRLLVRDVFPRFLRTEEFRIAAEILAHPEHGSVIMSSLMSNNTKTREKIVEDDDTSASSDESRTTNPGAGGSKGATASSGSGGGGGGGGGAAAPKSGGSPLQAKRDTVSNSLIRTIHSRSPANYAVRSERSLTHNNEHSPIIPHKKITTTGQQHSSNRPTHSSRTAASPPSGHRELQHSDHNDHVELVTSDSNPHFPSMEAAVALSEEPSEQEMGVGALEERKEERKQSLSSPTRSVVDS